MILADLQVRTVRPLEKVTKAQAESVVRRRTPTPEQLALRGAKAERNYKAAKLRQKIKAGQARIDRTQKQLAEWRAELEAIKC